jgi:uncharacterized membrane protein YfcA
MTALGLVLACLVGVTLGFFGGGGSILTVPLLVYVFGLEPKSAIASSLLVVGLASLTGALQHARLGNVRLGQGLVFGVAGMAGAYLGGRISAWIDGGLLLVLFAAMMLLTATAMWRGRRAERPEVEAPPAAPVRLLAQGFAVGTTTGLVGAGGGFLIVPALALWAGMPMTAAIGTSLLVIVLNAAAGFAGYASHVAVDARLVASVAAAAVVGSLIGTRLATRVDPTSLRRAFAAFVMVMGALILVREGATVAETLDPALPHTWPQVAFAVTMLVLGGVAGRSSMRAERLRAELELMHGAGI